MSVHLSEPIVLSSSIAIHIYRNDQSVILVIFVQKRETYRQIQHLRHSFRLVTRILGVPDNLLGIEAIIWTASIQPFAYSARSKSPLFYRSHNRVYPIMAL